MFDQSKFSDREAASSSLTNLTRWVVVVLVVGIEMRLHQLEFEKLYPLPKWRMQARANYLSKATHDAAQSYGKNINRIVAMSMVPAAAFRDGELWRKRCDEAMQELKTTDEQSPAVGKLATKKFNTENSKINMRQIGHYREVRRQMFEAHKNVEGMWSKTPHMHDALHYFLQTLIIQTQIAHEVLTEELCNNTLALGLKSTVTPTEREWRGLGFISRNKTRATYMKVFPLDNTKMMDALYSPHIDALALVRNVLVHKSGVIDRTFMNGMNGVPLKPGMPHAPPLPALSYFKNLGVNKKLLITAESVRKLIDPAIPLGYDLIYAVESWIHAHP